MSRLIDNGRARAARLLAKHGVKATITRTSAIKTVADRVAGTKGGSGSTVVLEGHGFWGTRERTMADGTIVQLATATLNIDARKGDRLTIGSRTMTVGDVEIVDPDGGGAIIVRADVE